LAEAFRQSGIDCRVVENLALERWRKLVWNISFNGLAVAAGGIDTEKILTDPELYKEIRALMYEVIAAANECGFPLENAVADEQLRLTRSIGTYKPSTLVDFEAGNPLELEAIWGEPLRRAKAAGAEVPRLEKLYSVLKTLDAQRAGDH
jgi:2-dehydropantoate 2-reductase